MALDMIELASLCSWKEDSVKGSIIQILAEEWPLTVKEIFQKTKQDFGKDVSYQAVHKAVQELVLRKVLSEETRTYLINPLWLQEIETFASLTLDKYSENQLPKASKQRGKQCKVQVYDSADSFYKLMVPLLRKGKEFRFSTKSPSLVISKEEEQTPARKKYVEELKKAIERGAKIKYLISSDATKELIIEGKDRTAFEKLKKFSNFKNIKIKCAPTKAIMSYAVTKRDLFINPTAITHFSAVGVIHFRGEDMSMVQQLFDIIFAEADEADKLIEEIEGLFPEKSNPLKGVAG